jgi:hypothetical protein
MSIQHPDFCASQDAKTTQYMLVNDVRSRLQYFGNAKTTSGAGWQPKKHLNTATKVGCLNTD